MFPFIISDTPDQVYRLLSSLFLHAGVIHIAITVSLHHALLADFEKLIGSVRIAILYLGSGVAGNLASSLFLPFKPEVSLIERQKTKKLRLLLICNRLDH